MKLLTKRGFKFVTGMFWQVPDYGKKSISLTRIMKDTGYDAYCTIKSLNNTYGFCNHSGLQGYKQVASLGKFIIEAAKLTSEYKASIICYKFKNQGDLDDEGKILKEDLFGYLVLLNGTICPIEGEYVAPFELVKNAVIEKAKLYSIDTLYLPIDVAQRFLSIFERLDYALHAKDSNLLFKRIFLSASQDQLTQLLNFIQENLQQSLPHKLIQYLIENSSNLIRDNQKLNFDEEELHKLITNEKFRLKLKENIRLDSNIRYLVANVLQVPLSSDEIFWNNKLKYNHNKTCLKTIRKEISKKYKYPLLLFGVGVIGYMGYGYFENDRLPIAVKTVDHKVIQIRPIALSPTRLIALCLGNGKDRFFKDLNLWTLTSIKCNSLGFKYTFMANHDTSLAEFKAMVGQSGSLKLQGKNGVFSQKFGVILPESSFQVSNASPNYVRNNLFKNTHLYSYQVTIKKLKSYHHQPINTQTLKVNQQHKNKFTLVSQLSPVFLLHHGVFNQVKLTNINMKFDKSTGLYSWSIKGVF